MQRQEILESLNSKLSYLSDEVLASLLNIVNSIEVTEDEEGYITYGNDDTEHLLSNPANEQWLRESIKEIEQGNTIKVTLEELEKLAQ